MDKPQYKRIVVSTPVRTGSTWIWNVCRKLLENNGADVWPKTITWTTEVEPADQCKEVLANPDRLYIQKLHMPAVAADHRTLVITATRKVESFLYSFIKFRVGDLSNGLYWYYCWADWHKANKDQYWLIRYEDIEDSNIDTIRYLNTLLMTNRPEEELRKIELLYSKRSITSLTPDGTVIKKDKPDYHSTINLETGFHANHVNKSKTTWQDFFSIKEKEEIDRWKDGYRGEDTEIELGTHEEIGDIDTMQVAVPDRKIIV